TPSDLSKHAKVRIDARGFTLAAVEAVLKFGRLVYVRGAAIFAIGRKEVIRFAKDGIKLGHLEGIQVVCSEDGLVLTAYRNNDFRGLRPSRRAANHKRGRRKG
ncbi:DUF4258 domain-containing protein, partial [Myxococcota bacterium]|nr:DUF4258 domain-containing protein [Myxococcota bacterium]